MTSLSLTWYLLFCGQSLPNICSKRYRPRPTGSSAYTHSGGRLVRNNNVVSFDENVGFETGGCPVGCSVLYLFFAAHEFLHFFPAFPSARWSRLAARRVCLRFDFPLLHESSRNLKCDLVLNFRI